MHIFRVVSCRLVRSIVSFGNDTEAIGSGDGPAGCISRRPTGAERIKFSGTLVGMGLSVSFDCGLSHRGGRSTLDRHFRHCSCLCDLVGDDCTNTARSNKEVSQSRWADPHNLRLANQCLGILMPSSLRRLTSCTARTTSTQLTSGSHQCSCGRCLAQSVIRHSTDFLRTTVRAIGEPFHLVFRAKDSLVPLLATSQNPKVGMWYTSLPTNLRPRRRIHQLHMPRGNPPIRLNARHLFLRDYPSGLTKFLRILGFRACHVLVP